MTPESRPKKSEWMQIAESDNASSNLRKVDKRLTLGTLVSVGAIVLAGSLFANASDEPAAVADVSAVADITSVASSVTSEPTSSAPSPSNVVAVVTPQASKIQSPAIAQLPTGGEDEDDEHEGRGERGEHRDRYEEHDDGDDD
jgi:hypothetical protein